MTLNESNSVAEMEKYILTIEDYQDIYHGKGIVICGGGVKYFTNAWVCISILRQRNCALPIQFWHLGEKECDERMKELMAELDVVCIDALQLRSIKPARILNGWELKAYAILHSEFKEVILLDSDNVALINPEDLFSTPEYLNTGAIFWPDYGRLDKDRQIWKLCNIEYRDEPEFETGQIVINKHRCWNAINLTMWINEYSDFFYKYIHGDKETFHMAFRKLHQPYSMPSTHIFTLEGTMCQHDFQGQRIFQHRNLKKWQFHHPNDHVEGFIDENLCLTNLNELKSKWNGKISGAKKFEFGSKSVLEKNLAHELCNQVFLYHRIGHDKRGITFNTDGTVELGGGNCEVLWDIDDNGENAILTISSESEVISRLEYQEGNWTGRWITFERMPVCIEPCSKIHTSSGIAPKNSIAVVKYLNDDYLYDHAVTDLKTNSNDYGYKDVKVLESQNHVALQELKNCIAINLLSKLSEVRPDYQNEIVILLSCEHRLTPAARDSLNTATAILTPSPHIANILFCNGINTIIKIVTIPFLSDTIRFKALSRKNVFNLGIFIPSKNSRDINVSKLINTINSEFSLNAGVKFTALSTNRNDSRNYPLDNHILRNCPNNLGQLNEHFDELSALILPPTACNNYLFLMAALHSGTPLILPDIYEYSNLANRTQCIKYDCSIRKHQEGLDTICYDIDTISFAQSIRSILNDQRFTMKLGANATISANEQSFCTLFDSIDEVLGSKPNKATVPKSLKSNNSNTRKVITMIGYNRPEYTKMVLDSLSHCEGIKEYLLLARIEPGNDETIELFHEVDFCDVSLGVNKTRLGCGLNTFNAWQEGFKISDFIIHIEDDTVPGIDCLRFMEHCSDKFRDNDQIFSISAYNNTSCLTSQHYAYSTRNKYSCWITGIWKSRWNWARGQWSRDTSRYAVKLSNAVEASGRKEVFPLLSRSQNIGVEGGLHVPTAEWHQQNHHTPSWVGNFQINPGNYHEIAVSEALAN